MEFTGVGEEGHGWTSGLKSGGSPTPHPFLSVLRTVSTQTKNINILCSTEVFPGTARPSGRTSQVPSEGGDLRIVRQDRNQT